MISILSTCVLHGVYVLLKDLLSQNFLGQGVGHMPQSAGVNLRITLQCSCCCCSLLIPTHQALQQVCLEIIGISTGSC